MIRAVVSGITPHTTWVRNPRKSNWEELRSGLRHKLVNFKSRYGTPRKLKHIEEFLRIVVVTAFEENCLLIKKRTEHEKLSWSKELEDRRKETRKLFNRAKRKRSTVHSNAYKENQRLYNELIEKTRNESRKQWCSNTSTISDTAKLTKILADAPKSNLKFIKAADGGFTRIPAGTLHRLMEINFPDFELGGVNRESPDLIRRKADSEFARQVVTPVKTREAIWSFEPYKALGPDNISPALLQQSLEVIIGLLTGLRSCTAIGYTPKQWLKAKVIFIPKPGRTSYTEVTDFRFISLTSFLLKHWRGW